MAKFFGIKKQNAYEMSKESPERILLFRANNYVGEVEGTGKSYSFESNESLMVPFEALFLFGEL